MSPSVLRRSSIMAWLGAALVAGSLTGCAGTTGSSRLARGENYTSGQERYDSFFQSVSDLKFRADNAQGDSELRKKLAKAVGLGEGAKRDEAIEAARTKSEALKKDGGKFFVVVAPQPKLIVKKGTDEAKGTEDFAKAVEELIKQGIARSDELDGMAREASALEDALGPLKSEVAQSFSDSSTREQVELELEAAKSLIDASRLRAEGESGRALRFVVLLASAVDSGAAAELLAMEAGAAAKNPKTPKGKWTGKAGGGGSGKPAGKKKNDFDP